MPETIVVSDSGDDSSGANAAETSAAIAANDAAHEAENAAESAEDAEESSEVAENAADAAEDSAETAATGASIASGAASESEGILGEMRALFTALPGEVARAVRETLVGTETENVEPSQAEITAEDESPEPHWLFKPLWGKAKR